MLEHYLEELFFYLGCFVCDVMGLLLTISSSH